MTELELIFKACLALSLVLLIMYIILLLIQKYTKFGNKGKFARKNALKIENIIYIDQNNKIINISNKFSNSNYIIGISKNNSFLIDKYKFNAVSEDEKKI